MKTGKKKGILEYVLAVGVTVVLMAIGVAVINAAESPFGKPWDRPGGQAQAANVALGTQMGTKYESIEFDLASGQTDFPIAGILNGAPVSNLTGTGFQKQVRIHLFQIRTDVEITIKFNDASNDPITIEAGRPFAFGAIEITDVFITNSANAQIRIILS